MHRKRLLGGSPKLIAVAAAIGVAILAAACSSSGGGTSGKVNLTYAVWATPETPGYQQSIKVFEKAHPNIHVSIESFPYTAYQSKLTTAFTGGGGPDVFWVNTPMLASWIKDGVMEDLTSKIKAAGIDMSQYLQPLVALHQYNGKLYGLPKDWDTIAYFYNVSYFKQHHIAVPSSLSWNPSDGGTWVQFLRELTTDTAGHNALSPAFNPGSVATYGTDAPNEMQWGFEPYLAENGVNIISKPYAKNVAFGTAAGKQTFQFLMDLMYRYHVAAPGSDLGTDAAANNTEDQALFAQGKVATIEGGDWEIPALKSAVRFPVGVMTFPAGPQGSWTVLNGLIDAVNAHGPNQQAAWELEQWLGSAASERILTSGGYIWSSIPSLDPLFSDYWKQHGIDVSPFLAESKWNNVKWPVTPGMDNAQLDIANLLAPAYLDHEPVSAAVNKAAAQAGNDLATAG